MNFGEDVLFGESSQGSSVFAAQQRQLTTAGEKKYRGIKVQPPPPPPPKKNSPLKIGISDNKLLLQYRAVLVIVLRLCVLFRLIEPLLGVLAHYHFTNIRMSPS